MPHSLYSWYRQRKIASQIADYAPREVTHTYGGIPLRIRLEDPLAQGWYDQDWDEPSVIPFLRERGVLRGGAVFDIGAHQAVVALMLAHTDGVGQVVAVEAEPHNARVAAINRDLNNATNLTIVHAAGAEKAGSTTFSEGLNGRVDELTRVGTVTVPSVTIDGLASTYGTPDLVFVDVEGFEQRVLAGARDMLANGHTSFVVEVHEPTTLAAFGGDAKTIVEYFAAFDTYVARADDEPFSARGETVPAERFFLAAIPAAQ